MTDLVHDLYEYADGSVMTITCCTSSHVHCQRGGAGCECGCHYIIQPPCELRLHEKCRYHLECMCPCHMLRVGQEALRTRERVSATLG